MSKSQKRKIKNKQKIIKQICTHYPEREQYIKKDASLHSLLKLLEKDQAHRTLYAEFRRHVNFFKDEDYNPEFLSFMVDLVRRYVDYGEVEQKKFGEVMTPLDLVDEMLDCLPEETWSNPDLKILDPANGCGVFPSLLVKRLYTGLASWEPDETKRYKHIIENMIYACEIQDKNVFLTHCVFDPNELFNLNIFDGSFLSPAFDKFMKQEWGVEKFDIVIGNPPYQEKIPGNKRMRPLYNKFTEKSIHIGRKVLFVTPSRWFTGSADLKKFKEKMLASPNRLELVKTFSEKNKVFGKNVEIKGGVSYFLYNHDFEGQCMFDGTPRQLDAYDIIFPREFEGIIDKVQQLPSVTELTNTQNFYGLGIKDKNLYDLPSSSPSELLCHVSKSQGGTRYVEKSNIKNSHNISKWKILTPAGAWSGGSGFGNLTIAHPNEVYTKTYFSFQVKTKEEVESLHSLLSTGFANVMLSLRKNTQNIKPGCCKWIPLLPLDRTWSDEGVCEYLGLTKEEIQLVTDSAAKIKGPHR
jgi:site-specific DNA-methyltransferase (adenine-specific)